MQAIVGGTAAELGGGKFANGAVTAAFVMMYNDMAHSSKRYLLGIHSAVSSKASFTAGHAWISVTDMETGDFHTYGLWATEAGVASNGSGGVLKDMEIKQGLPLCLKSVYRDYTGAIRCY